MRKLFGVTIPKFLCQYGTLLSHPPELVIQSSVKKGHLLTFLFSVLFCTVLSFLLFFWTLLYIQYSWTSIVNRSFACFLSTRLICREKSYSYGAKSEECLDGHLGIFVKSFDCSARIFRLWWSYSALACDYNGEVIFRPLFSFCSFIFLYLSFPSNRISFLVLVFVVFISSCFLSSRDVISNEEYEVGLPFIYMFFLYFNSLPSNFGSWGSVSVMMNFKIGKKLVQVEAMLIC